LLGHKAQKRDAALRAASLFWALIFPHTSGDNELSRWAQDPQDFVWISTNQVRSIRYLFCLFDKYILRMIVKT
jgi:hypothetical protein